jgi:transcriptional regulator with PAS, ATPase and Fis domain
MAYRWAGNVRELWNVMQYAWVMATASGGLILPNHLPGYILAPAQPIAPNPPMPTPGFGSYHAPGQVDTPKSLTLEEMEREQILRVLDKHRGNKPAVAAELGISLKTLYNKLNRYAELGLATG